MSKAYIVYRSWGTCDDSSVVGVFLDESKADNFISERMVPRDKELERLEKCMKCKRIDTKDYNDNEEYFDFENTCDIAKIGIDRNGKYCENEISSYYGLSTDSYWKNETEIIE